MSAPDQSQRASIDPGAGAVGEEPDQLTATLEALSAPEMAPARRRGLVRQLVRHARAQRAQLWRPRSAVRWVAETLGEVAPQIPVRDLPTLQAHHRGRDGEALAERLVRNAARATAGVGAAGGGLAAVQWTSPPTLLATPVLLSAETLAVIAIEVKLIGELHQAYHVAVPGAGATLAMSLLRSWAHQRGVNPMTPGHGAATVLSTAARTQLRDRVSRRFGRNLATLGPLLTGAAAASYLNRRATHALADRLRADLRRFSASSR